MFAWLAAHAVDVVILAIVAAVVVSIIRGMRKGSIRACDCGKGCESCGPECPLATIHLSEEDLERLQALHAGGGDAA